MAFNWDKFSRRHRDKIIAEWVRRLKTEVSWHYSSRPKKELWGTVKKAYDANCRVIVNNDYRFINRFIDEITKMRLEAGFPLDDVQKAFELYRNIVLPILIDESSKEDLNPNISRINNCLAYTIYRFSDHFQKMHKKHLQDYANRLEEDVRIRTAELQESERKYKGLVEEINDGYLVINNDVIAFVNPAFCSMHGYRLNEVISRPFSIFIDPKSRKKVMDIIKKNLCNLPAPNVFEYNRLTRDGRSLPTEITVKPTSYKDVRYNICLCRDITERVRMEKKIREAERMAYIGQITASLSHEIRNPLSAVKMNLQILKKNSGLQGNDKRRIDISVREVNRLEGILQELLDFAKPLSITPRPAMVNSIISECVELLEIKCQEKRLMINMDLDPEIPVIQADPEKIEQVVINLLLNAIDSSDSGGCIMITSRFRRISGFSKAEIIIEDDGVCIPENRLTDIFKPFYTTKTKGTGLGLANVKRIAEAHGGSVEVKNRVPCGAAFRVSLPVGEDHG